MYGLGGYHEVAGAFAGYHALNTYVAKYHISGPSPNDRYFSQIYHCQEELHGKYWLMVVSAYLFVWESKELFPKG